MRRQLQHRVCWFSFELDALPLMQAVTCAMETMPPGTTFHVFDQDTRPLHPRVVSWLRDRGVSVRQTTFDRRVNLNGASSICGQLDCYASVAQDPEDVIWKTDCDTLILKPEALAKYYQRPTLVGAGCYCPRAWVGWWGICYTLRAGIVPELRATFGTTDQVARLAEDIYLSRMIIHNFPADTATAQTSHTGGAYMSYNWKTQLTVAEYIKRFGIVTFGNRGQLAPLTPWQQRQKQAATMALFNERHLS